MKAAKGASRVEDASLARTYQNTVPKLAGENAVALPWDVQEAAKRLPAHVLTAAKLKDRASGGPELMSAYLPIDDGTVCRVKSGLPHEGRVCRIIGRVLIGMLSDAAGQDYPALPCVKIEWLDDPESANGDWYAHVEALVLNDAPEEETRGK